MRQIDSRLIVSPTDLVGYLACAHRASLELEAARGGRIAPFDGDPVLELVSRKGAEHEARHLERLRSQGLRIVDLSNFGNTTIEESVAAERATVQAMRDGADVVYQGVFFDGRWRGRPDFLLRVGSPCSFGDWSYEAADTKLARDVKAGAIVQLSLYSLRLGDLQGAAPRHMHVITGVDEKHSYRVADFASYVRNVRDRFLATLDHPETKATSYPHPVEHCRVCNWAGVCFERRRSDDHLSLVAGMTRSATRKLTSASVATTAALGAVMEDAEVGDLAKTTFRKLRAQASLQLEQRADGVVRYELLPVPEEPAPPVKPPKAGETDKRARLGLTGLPEPADDDLFFDIEADPWAGESREGLEYLFGVLAIRDGVPSYEAMWAHTAVEEKAMVEAFIDRCLAARKANEKFHVYHYGAYETAALKRLVSRYATRDNELDQLLRGEVFVDLFGVVRHGVRVSQESYSLKKVEALYMKDREGPVTKGGFSVVEYERWLDDRDPKHLDDLAAYNRDDCVSTWKLRDWLEDRRAEAEVQAGRVLPRLEPKPIEPKEDRQAEIEEVEALERALRAGLPVTISERNDEQQARWLLASLLDFHRREARPEWWRWYDLRSKSAAELVAERDAIGELAFERDLGPVDRSRVYRYRFEPEQEQKFNEGDGTVDPVTGRGAGSVVAIDGAAGIIELKRASGGHPTAVIPNGPIETKALRQALVRFGTDVVQHGVASMDSFQAQRDVLLRRQPRIFATSPGGSIHGAGESNRAAAIRAVLALQESYLAIQGPPGTGKTWLAAQMIVELHKAGKKVAITAQSHKVIENLMRAVLAQGGDEFRIAQRPDGESGIDDRRVRAGKDNKDIARLLESGEARISAGTVWLYASKEMTGLHDVLFIDEAGQYSLANALAAAQTARNVVLIGDPNQLPQVTRGVHPDGSGVSSLDHVLNGAATIGASTGLFLDETHRLHPDICTFISGAFYEGRLRSNEKAARVRINGDAGLAGTGIRIRAVQHVDRGSRSYEEVAVIEDLMRDLLSRTWIDQDGCERPLTVNDILIVAPFNSQVAAIRERLRAELKVAARVGTVDKFQGQEGAVVLFSMTCSTAEDAPRDLEFLYSRHRFNVAISRAQALAVVVMNPALLEAQCRTPEQISLVNSLCRFAEEASRI